jgi:hypothetical protein
MEHLNSGVVFIGGSESLLSESVALKQYKETI